MSEGRVMTETTETPEPEMVTVYANYGLPNQMAWRQDRRTLLAFDLPTPFLDAEPLHGRERQGES